METDFEKHLTWVDLFVDCYLIFSGVAGKCDNCCANVLCRRLNEDCLDFARKDLALAKGGYIPECLGK